MTAPPRPPRFAASAIGQTLRFLKNPFALLDDAQEQCGEIFTLELLGLGEWVFLCSPALVKEMFKAPPGTLAAGEVNRDLLGFLLGSDATFTLDGTAHRERQRLVHPHLNGPRVTRYVPAIRETAENALGAWPQQRPFALLEPAHRISLEVMIGAMFGASGAEACDRLTDLFGEFARKGPRSLLITMPYLQRDLGPWSPWGKILRLKQSVVDAFSKEIRQRRAATDDDDEEPRDIATSLARARTRDGELLSDSALVDEVINLLFAGHETTGNGLTWTMETILSHPEVEERVRREISTVLGEAPIEPEHLAHLEVLQAVIRETLRYRPLAPMAGVRLVKQPFEIGGYTIPPGMLVAQCFPIMAKRPELFACPHRFEPDHFYQRKTKPFEWNPFGGGTRMCIGRGLAEVELAVVIATLLQNARFRLDQRQVRATRNGFFFSPNRGLRVVVEERLRNSTN